MSENLTNKDLRIIRQNSKAVTIVHSRSGNTASVAMTLSEILQTDYFRIEGPEGIGNSFFSSPNRNKELLIKPESVELQNYSLVILGSPIWYWHPTAVIFSFIKKHNLANKKVILFYTFEGGVWKSAIAEWKVLVEKQGGFVIDVIEINRKVHKTKIEIDSEIKKIIESKKDYWLK